MQFLFPRPERSTCLVGICLCSNCWDQFSQTCHVFSQLFNLNTPRYFLNFAYTAFNTPWIKWMSTLTFSITWIMRDMDFIMVCIQTYDTKVNNHVTFTVTFNLKKDFSKFVDEQGKDIFKFSFPCKFWNTFSLKNQNTFSQIDSSLYIVDGYVTCFVLFVTL